MQNFDGMKGIVVAIMFYFPLRFRLVDLLTCQFGCQDFEEDDMFESS